MKSVQLSELGPVTDAVRNGETVEIRDGDQLVAQVVPIRQRRYAEEYIDELVAHGKATKGTGVLPDWFFTDPLPASESGSALEQLLEDRRSRDW